MSPAMRDGIVKRGSRWAFKLELPPDPATGKRRQKWVSGFRTRKEAQAARDDARARLRVGAYLAPSRETVGDYLTTWLAGVRGEYAPGAFDAAKLHVERYIIPRIGAVRLAELTTPMVKAFYADVAETGRVRGDQPLSAKTVHNVHRTLSRALNDAVAELPPRILVNPAARAHKVPPSPEQPTWTAEQLRRFYLHIEDDRLFALWRLAATTGLRRGELAGLRWVDVDLDAGHLTLRVQRAKGGGSVVERQLKGKRGRLVSLDPATAAALRAHRTGQLEERMR
jgi:integrase